MGKKTISQAKNDIKTCLNEIVDPPPGDKERDSVWKYFNSQCCYCMRPLVREKREGHLDHLVSKNDGGVNHISNRVLSCSICNGDEKRDTEWVSFLKKKSTREGEFKIRKRRIEKWIERHKMPESQVKRIEILRAPIEEQVKLLNSELEASAKLIKELLEQQEESQNRNGSK